MPNDVNYYQDQIDATRYLPFDGAKDLVGGHLFIEAESPFGGTRTHWITGLRLYPLTVVIAHRHAHIANDGSAPTMWTQGTTSEINVTGGLWTGRSHVFFHDDRKIGESLSASIFERMRVQTSAGFALTSAHLNIWDKCQFATQEFGVQLNRSKQNNANQILRSGFTASSSSVIQILHGVENLIAGCSIQGLIGNTSDPAIELGELAVRSKIADVYFEALNRPHAVAGRGDALIEKCRSAVGSTTDSTVNLARWKDYENIGFAE